MSSCPFKVFNLKETAKTMNFLQEHGLLIYPDLEAACNAAVQKYHGFANCTKVNDIKMKEISKLQEHIGTYTKTHVPP